jgi:hypothetical protein
LAVIFGALAEADDRAQLTMDEATALLFEA